MATNSGLVIRWLTRQNHYEASLKTQPYGKDAAHRNQELLTNAKQVSLELDSTDDYDRALAYVYADMPVSWN